MEPHKYCKCNERAVRTYFSFYSSLSLCLCSRRENINCDRDQMFLGAAYFIMHLFVLFCVIPWNPLTVRQGVSLISMGSQEEYAKLLIEAYSSHCDSWQLMWCATSNHQLFIVKTFSRVPIKDAFIDSQMTYIFIAALSLNSFRTCFA